MDGDLVKVITWFDNGWGYTARIIEVLDRLDAREES
jgi:glyceraldehyde-3-phosphate dehydrogenase/erythrose-4-phosphate dehydrogenase